MNKSSGRPKAHTTTISAVADGRFESNSEVRARNWAVRFTLKNRRRQPGLSGLKSAKRRRHSGHLGAISSRIRSCGHLLRERSKSNDDFGCLLTGANNITERLPHFLQIWRVSAQPV